MASIVDMCNLGLGLIGDEAVVSSIDPPDGTTQAVHCQRFYPIVRDALLERYAWGFATKRTSVAALTSSTTDEWAFEYQVPPDCIRPLALLPEGFTFQIGFLEDYARQFKREGDRILSNVDGATLVYVFRQEDPTRYTPLFVETLAQMMASRLAGPIIKGKEGRAVSKDWAQTAEITLARATAADGNAQSFRPQHIPKHLRARSYGSDNEALYTGKRD